MSTGTAAPWWVANPRPAWGATLARGIGLPALRVALVAIGATLAWVLLGVTAGWMPFPGAPVVTVVAMAPVNILCLWLVARSLRAEGRRIGDLVGYRAGRLGRDILWGLLWLVVLAVPFQLTIMAVMWLLHGDGMLAAFETVFFDPNAIPPYDPAVAFALAVIALVTFVPLNAPAEELLYRGVAQGALARRMPIALAILIPAVFFGLQHIWYAPTPAAVVVYACAFFVWGACSGVIAWRQGRLLPLIVAHLLVNLFLTLPAFAVPFLIANGAA
ncbi:MAG: CPBP family intramembrane glutamic endopeptidase [Microbacterium sp.]